MARLMNILLIQPFQKDLLNFFYSLAYKLSLFPSLLIPQLAALTPSNYKIIVVDEGYQKINFDGNFDLVGITVITATANRSYEIADEFRKRGVPVVLGGYHPTALPFEAKQHADSIVIGEAELSWPQLLQDFEKGILKPYYKNIMEINPNIIPIPKRKILENVQLSSGIFASRGCTTGCKFCTIHMIEGTRLRLRPIENVISDIKKSGSKFLTFYDASLTLNPEYSKQLFKRLSEMNVKFTCFGNSNVLNKDKELLRLSKGAGCTAWSIGFESISQDSINNMNKKTNNVDDYYSVVKNIHNHGISVIGSFIFGFDNDYQDVFRKTDDKLSELNVDSADFFILTPFPGTLLFNELEKEGRITSYDWSKYTGANVVFKPKNMTDDELLKGTKDIAHDFYSIKKFTKRMTSTAKLGFHPFLETTSRNLSNIFYNLTTPVLRRI